MARNANITLTKRNRGHRDDDFGKLVGEGTNNLSDKEYSRISDQAARKGYGLSDSDIARHERKYRKAAMAYYSSSTDEERQKAIKDASKSAALLTYVNFHDERDRIGKQATEWAKKHAPTPIPSNGGGNKSNAQSSGSRTASKSGSAG